MANSERAVTVEVAPVFTHHLSRGGDGCFDADKPETDFDIIPSTSGKAFDDAASNHTSIPSKVAPIISTDTPFFHFDLVSAVRSAEDTTGK